MIVHSKVFVDDTGNIAPSHIPPHISCQPEVDLRFYEEVPTASGIGHVSHR